MGNVFGTLSAIFGIATMFAAFFLILFGAYVLIKLNRALNIWLRRNQ